LKRRNVNKIVESDEFRIWKIEIENGKRRERLATELAEDRRGSEEFAEKRRTHPSKLRVGHPLR
jgi:hypothetical protein